MNLDRLEYFVAVAEHLNFTKAADACHVAQTAISRHIAALEDEIGCKLFYRTNRSVELTPAGKAFHSEIVPMLEHYRLAIEKAHSAYSGTASALHLGIGQYEMGFVSELFREFHSLFPDIQLSVGQYPYADLVKRLEDGSADVIFPHPATVIPENHVNIGIQHMFSARQGLLVSSEHESSFAFSRKRPVQAKDLAQETIFILTEAYGPISEASLISHMKAAGFFPAHITPVNSLNALFLMVKAGLGVAFVPAFLETELPDGLQIFSQKILPEQSYCSMTLKSSSNPAAELFANGILTSQTVMNRIKKRYLRQYD